MGATFEVAAGQTWTAEADAELLRRWHAGEDIKALREHFMRTRGAIAARLVRLGEAPNRAKLYLINAARGGEEGDEDPSSPQAAQPPGPTAPRSNRAHFAG